MYASWNGATQVSSWRVLAGAGAGPMTAVASAARSGFETAIPVAQGYQSFRLQALSAGARVIGAHKVERVVDLRDINLTGFYRAALSLTPDDQPVMTRDSGSMEIFTLDWRTP